jgi:NADH-quinone oxidoreductase subunit D
MSNIDASRRMISGNSEYPNLEQNFAPGFRVERKAIEGEDDSDRYIKLSIGPQHPGSGHMRIIVVVDGDTIVHADPDVGYVHRGEEKMSESRGFAKCTTY